MGRIRTEEKSRSNGSYSDYNDDAADGLQIKAGKINDETKYYTENCAFFSYRKFQRYQMALEKNKKNFLGPLSFIKLY